MNAGTKRAKGKRGGWDNETPYAPRREKMLQGLQGLLQIRKTKSKKRRYKVRVRLKLTKSREVARKGDNELGKLKNGTQSHDTNQSRPKKRKDLFGKTRKVEKGEGGGGVIERETSQKGRRQIGLMSVTSAAMQAGKLKVINHRVGGGKATIVGIAED